MMPSGWNRLWHLYVLGGLAAGLAGILTAQSKRSKDSEMKKADSDISGDNIENPGIADGADQNA